MKHFNNKILINCVINNLNLDEIEELIFLSRELNINISFEPICFFEKNNKDNKLYINNNNKKYKEIILKIISLKKRGYPIINSITYLKNILENK